MSMIISHIKDHSISLYQVIYATYISAKYLYTATVKTSTNFYYTNFPSDMIFTKDYASTSDKQIGKLTRELNISYIVFIGSLIYLLSIRVDLSFAVHKWEKFSSNPGKVNFKVLVHFLRYIRENKTLGLKYYDDMKYATLSYLSRQANIKTEKKLMVFSDSSWKYFPDTGISTGAYIIFYQCGPIGHGIYVIVPVSWSIE